MALSASPSLISPSSSVQWTGEGRAAAARGLARPGPPGGLGTFAGAAVLQAGWLTC